MLGQNLNDAQQDTADKGAGNGADSSEYSRNKGLIPGMEPV